MVARELSPGLQMRLLWRLSKVMSVRAQRRAATGASRTGAAHVVTLGPIGRRDEFADGGGIADEVRKEVHLPCPCPDFRMSLPIDGHHSAEA